MRFKVKLEKLRESGKTETLTEAELEAKREAIKEEKALLSWQSDARPFKKRSAQYFLTVGMIAVFFSLLAILVRELIVVLVIVAVVFVSYVLALVKPDKIYHKISRSGLTSGNHSYLWSDLRSFWFTKKAGFELLVVETNLKFPGRLIIVLEGVAAQAVKNWLKKYIEFREKAPMDWFDKVLRYLGERWPLEPS